MLLKEATWAVERLNQQGTAKESEPIAATQAEELLRSEGPESLLAMSFSTCLASQEELLFKEHQTSLLIHFPRPSKRTTLISKAPPSI